MRLELLVGAPEFWERARADIAAARQRVLVQAMTFEGDAVGQAVSRAIKESLARDRRVLVDGYTRVNINDTALTPGRLRADRALAGEVAATHAMFGRLTASGVSVRVTNTVTPLKLNYPARNHKKLIVADDVAYVGGVNFSDHNFAWPDLMLRIEDGDAANAMAGDFDATFRGRPQPLDETLGSLRLISLDGRANREGFAFLFRAIGEARREIVVVSPYLTDPFTRALGHASGRGVAVSLITPWDNNKPIVRDALLTAARRYGFEVVLGPVMSHLKGMLIDGERLVLGSSNFDFASLAAEEELLAVVSDPTVIGDFGARVIAPARRDAVASRRPSELRGAACELALRAAAIIAASARNSARNAVDWPS